MNLYKLSKMENKTILIFGGSGSLGNALVKQYYQSNRVVIFSRDECKHWKMSLNFSSITSNTIASKPITSNTIASKPITSNTIVNNQIAYIIGDIRDFNRVQESILRVRPDIIIVASALKHIDRCEFAVEECVRTNYNGILNVCNVVEQHHLPCVVVYVSTDKACSPVNSYGISKAMGERVMVEKSYYNYVEKSKFNESKFEESKHPKYVTVRYGNVLNSNGSILQILHAKGRDPDVSEFSLTHPQMTRFVQTLEQSVALIEHAILSANDGDIVVPKTIQSIWVKDLIELFSEKYNKPYRITNLRPGEKLSETLINTTQFTTTLSDDNYYYIKPTYLNEFVSNESNSIKFNSNEFVSNKSNSNKFVSNEFNSNIMPIDKDELRNLLIRLNLL